MGVGGCVGAGNRREASSTCPFIISNDTCFNEGGYEGAAIRRTRVFCTSSARVVRSDRLSVACLGSRITDGLHGFNTMLL